MTIIGMILAVASAYGAGIATAIAWQSRRAILAAPVPQDWLPSAPKVKPPPPMPPAPTLASPYAPKAKPKPIEPPPRERILRWPRAADGSNVLATPQFSDSPPRYPPSMSFLPHNEL